MSNDMLTEVRFWAQVMTDAKRIVICSPDLESRCKGFVDARGLGGLIEVRVSPYMRDDTILVIDPGGIDAMNAQALTGQILFAR